MDDVLCGASGCCLLVIGQPCCEHSIFGGGDIENFEARDPLCRSSSCGSHGKSMRRDSKPEVMFRIDEVIG